MSILLVESLAILGTPAYHRTSPFCQVFYEYLAVAAYGWVGGFRWQQHPGKIPSTCRLGWESGGNPTPRALPTKTPPPPRKIRRKRQRKEERMFKRKKMLLLSFSLPSSQFFIFADKESQKNSNHRRTCNHSASAYQKLSQLGVI